MENSLRLLLIFFPPQYWIVCIAIMIESYHFQLGCVCVCVCLSVCLYTFLKKQIGPFHLPLWGLDVFGVVWWIKEWVAIVTQSSGTLRFSCALCICENILYLYLSATCPSVLSAWWPHSRGETGAGKHPPQKTRATARHTSKTTHSHIFHTWSPEINLLSIKRAEFIWSSPSWPC